MGIPTDPTDPTGGAGGGGGGTQPPSSYGTLIFSQPFNKKDASSALEVVVYLNCAATDDLRFSAYLFLDGTLIQIGTYNLIFDNNPSSAQGTITMPVIQDGVAAGNHTITLRVLNRDHASLTIIAGSLIKASELRNAAR